jgi:hypothetical protein
MATSPATINAVERIDLRAAARYQRWIIRLLSLLIVSQVGGALLVPRFGLALGIAGLAVQLVVYLASIVFLVLLLGALKVRVLLIVISAIAAMVPFVNLLVLALASMQATAALKRAGAHVGLLGARADEVERITALLCCPQCGYSLFANVTARCPECGWEVPRAEPVAPPLAILLPETAPASTQNEDNA